MDTCCFCVPEDPPTNKKASTKVGVWMVNNPEDRNSCSHKHSISHFLLLIHLKQPHEIALEY